MTASSSTLVPGAHRSARAVVGLAYDMVRPASVLDVGCGRGAWLAEWIARGLREVCGIDGSYVDLTTLTFPRVNFITHDLSQEFRLDRRFALVQCVEVAEHLPQHAAVPLIESLTRHGDVILFSAAVPGQGGEHHINEQPLEYWRAQFDERGYSVYDPLRPLLRARTEVEPWYRYNLLLYASPAGEATLTMEARRSRIPEAMPIPDVAPLAWRARNFVLRRFPRAAIEVLARMKHQLVRAARQTAR